ncbi:MAG TPA: C-type lectin domain-containing protein, partial [Steroidobacteraceae bacterium]|nr:C-type lectin domain-containing protein [Steroidobacteraceae bacterium]
MDVRITVIAGLTALFAAGSVHAQAACPSFSGAGTAINDETGHTYFLYASPGITWDQAQACVAALPQQPAGVPAHLATITSSSENQWIVDELLMNANPPLAQWQVWVGGFQGSLAAEPREGWRWVNNDGPIPVPGSSVTLGYSNWSAAP